MKQRFQSPTWRANILFWSWNSIFLVFMLLGFAPLVLAEVFNGVRRGVIPPAFLVSAALLVLIPIGATVLGATLLRGAPQKLLVLGYGIEGPLMILFLMRLFAVRELIAPVMLLLLAGGLGLATLLWVLLDQRGDERGLLACAARAFGLTLLLLVGLYASAWLAFYAPPVAVWTGDTALQILSGRGFSSSWRNGFSELIFAVFGMLAALYSATLFVALPIVAPIIYARAWWRSVRALATHSNQFVAVALPAATIVVCALLFARANEQSQRQAFALLEKPPATPAAAAALLDQQATVRDGLLNAYLAPQRYISTAGGVTHVSDMYKDALHLPAPWAAEVQSWYESVASPMLYEPVKPITPIAPSSANGWQQFDGTRQDEQRAAALYQQFFDQPIGDAERTSIVRAARSSWNVGQAEAAWRAVDEREVLLTTQEVTATEHGDWADFELHEVYQNQTAVQQEVVYYFSLPESAVITGLWLGNGPNFDKRFAAQVAPRGAAQQLYREEFARKVDPALVEQLGPREYRLRIFPLLTASHWWDKQQERYVDKPAPALHMWMTWRVLANSAGWALPQLAEKRNVYWDTSTTRRLNGAPMPSTGDAWLPAAAQRATTAPADAHRVDFPDDESVLLRPVVMDIPVSTTPLHLAVVVDRSRSMAAHSAALAAALGDLRTRTPAGTIVDAYLSASAFRGEQPSVVSLSALDPAQILFFGGQNPAELLEQFAALRANRSYDAIIVLTDNSGYEPRANTQALPLPAAPVWMVHLDGQFPVGYDDDTLSAIQGSGGGATGGVAEALMRIMAGLGGKTNTSRADVIDGYRWEIVPTSDAARLAPNVVADSAESPFAALAARRLILEAMQRQPESLTQPAMLDQLHAVATTQRIVTPFSSMIVLINEAQQQRLDELTKGNDRFSREHEEVGETKADQGLPITGVPEPEEWLLLMLAGAMLLWYLWSARRRSAILAS